MVDECLVCRKIRNILSQSLIYSLKMFVLFEIPETKN